MSEPLTEAELAAIETRSKRHETECLSFQDCCGSVDDVPRLVAEVRRLRDRLATTFKPTPEERAAVVQWLKSVGRK